MASSDEREESSSARRPDNRVELIFPGGNFANVRQVEREPMCASASSDAKSADLFVQERTALHALFVTETQKTKRLGLILAAGLLALACIIPIFAPAGREVVSYWISISLFVFSAGAIGFTNIFYRAKERELNLSSGGGPAGPSTPARLGT